ncbi:ANTAR domain-containing protein [Hymenobacter rubidus]|uniref:hypothetical protein n=1 Tax=Hymenobacter rubidus TaxID=1441626 RepID=UPI00191FAC30|nr:hypothetical protein [Hymenobacter rubidus]
MTPYLLRVVLAVAPAQQAYFERYLRDAGHEVVAVEARGETAFKAARLVHPDVVVLSGPLQGPLDSVALAAALRATEGIVPVVLATDPAELPELLARQFELPAFIGPRPPDA